MHTIFTIMVYAALGLGRPLNESNLGGCWSSETPLVVC